MFKITLIVSVMYQFKLICQCILYRFTQCVLNMGLRRIHLSLSNVTKSAKKRDIL